MLGVYIACAGIALRLRRARRSARMAYVPRHGGAK